MKLKTALKAWGDSYAISWYCIRGQYYGWKTELLASLLITMILPLLIVLTMIFSKEPDHGA